MLTLAGAISLGGCGANARLIGSTPAQPPLPKGFELVFNQRGETSYRSPINGQQRPGDDLEALVLRSIREARSELLVAVQELSLPEVARALVAKQREGITVKVVLENTYSTPWSQQHALDLNPHQRLRQRQLSALADRNHDGVLSSEEREAGDAVLILQRGGVPLIDDTADGSAGSGLMHHKFLIADRRVLVTGSANFTPSCIHGDPDSPSTRGNVNHLLRLESAPLAAVFVQEFQKLWGDGPQGQPDSRFGLEKKGTAIQRVDVQGTAVDVLFAPHRSKDPRNGLLVLEQSLNQARERIDLALFVFSAQNLTEALAHLRTKGVRLRLLADPGFAYRSFSEVLDLLGINLPDRRCGIEAGNKTWSAAMETVGVPRLAGGDKLHHKFAVIDRRTVITGSFNWSPSAAHGNDETLLLIHSPALASQFEHEFERMWRGAELGVAPRLERRWARMHKACGSGQRRPMPGR
ncbi:phosphatidylserine/phosphatidylglycerophosphate/cardiolipin synthase family protein [Cyanobium sp. Morenito 9A2]|uniref:phospholipase D-like domain-containing protein n=1 Tax=Cyanobium sp. Morenito 9A2 TaxID=2823718 RepID=UPI0020CBD3AA|nr:phospholipase D-like domain-containing protein [Cyanobium sp. Morenito 9A2]